MKNITRFFVVPVIALILIIIACRKPFKEKEVGLRLNATLSGSCEGPQRYRNIVFDNEDISVENNIVYRNTTQFHANDSYDDSTLRLDLYQPNQNMDTDTLRPLIIYMHGGGGFVGSKNDQVANCMNFAKRGYVVAAINYRLIKDVLPDLTGFNPDSVSKMKRIIYTGYYRAIQDARFAIRFAKHNAAAANVDTNKIFFSGLSNGGVQTLHVAYLDDAEARVLDDDSGYVDVDALGPLDFTNGNVPFTSTGKITAGICYSGWILNDEWIDAGDPPMILVHAESDNYAPKDEGIDYVYQIFYVWGPEGVERRLMDVNIDAYYIAYLDGNPTCLYYQCGGDHGDVVADAAGIGPVLRDSGVNIAFNALYDYYFCD